MIDGIRLKVCGLTSIVDAEFADRCGADYLGFILYPKSPRYLSLETFRAMEPRLPDRKKVAVSVEPTTADLRAMQESGFDFFQIHFRHDLPLTSIAEWSKAVGADRLWLAPKLPPGVDVADALLPFAKVFLLDTFHAEKFGGTGETGDWAKFSRHQLAAANKTWILSGGLNPENIGDALRKSAARFVDVNSGVESAPGVKNEGKLKRFVVRLHESRT
ncbi:MAG: phosphoribosylanthranilate isomerase [Opitutaceae bacterium]